MVVQFLTPIETIQGNTIDMDVNAVVFKSDMISGEVGPELSSMATMLIGQAFGTLLKRHYNLTAAVIGYDMRQSSQDLLVRVAGGLQAAGCATYEMGMLPTPLLQFHTKRTGMAGVMITTADPDPAHNGMKCFVGGHMLGAEAIEQLHHFITADDMESAPGKRFKMVDIESTYINFVASGFRPTPKLTVVVDAGYGMAGPYMPRILSRLGHDVVTLNCSPNSDFRTYTPSLTAAHQLENLALTVQANGAALGLFFNPEGTAVGVMDERGVVCDPVQVGRWLYQDVSARQSTPAPGDHPLLSGELRFLERYFGFADGIYAGGRLVELLAEDGRLFSEVLATME